MGQTPLGYAIGLRLPYMMEHLLTSGAKATGQDGQAGLWYAAQTLNTNLARQFIAHGAKSTAQIYREALTTLDHWKSDPLFPNPDQYHSNPLAQLLRPR